MNELSIRVSKTEISKNSPTKPAQQNSESSPDNQDQPKQPTLFQQQDQYKRKTSSGRLYDQPFSSKSGGQKTTSQIGISVSVPCVPTRTQRVLINKRQSARASTTAARLYRKPLSEKALDQSQSSKNFSSFISNSKSHVIPPFNSKELRFDGQLELKEYFNRDAGPGTYSEIASTIQSSLNSEMQKLVHFRRQSQIIKTFNNKTKRFIPTNDMLSCDPSIQVGPGQYHPQQPQEHIQAPRMDYKGDFSLPFNENNPLNYVKPLTVNIYFKQQTPGVGQYQPERIRSFEQGGREVFASKTERGIIDKRTARALFEKPAPGQYDQTDGFDMKWREQNQGTHQFLDKMQKQIVPVNLYDPHSAPGDEKNKQPEACTYKTHRLFDNPRYANEFEPRLDYVSGGGKIYNETNLDRFGLPIRPMKPINIVPGPGEYETTEPVYNVLGPKPAIAKGGFIPEAEIARFIIGGQPHIPGPSFYNANKEPKKISFLFNPSEKWIE